MVQCPKCRSDEIHASRTRTNWEHLRREITGKRPFRCAACGWRGWGVESGPHFSEEERTLSARALAREAPDVKGIAFAIGEAPALEGHGSDRRTKANRSSDKENREWSQVAPRSRSARTRTHQVGNTRYYAHDTAVIGQPCEVGDGTTIWYFSNVMAGARIGRGCELGQNVMIESGVIVGDHVTIQNNVSLYKGVVLEDYVFCGASCVFTNVINPRSELVRHQLFKPTIVKRGATIGANATIVCGATIGRFAFVGAGAVVRGQVPDYALMVGVPARQQGWMSRHGHRLRPDSSGEFICPESGWHYVEGADGRLTCRDWPEDRPTVQ